MGLKLVGRINIRRLRQMLRRCNFSNPSSTASAPPPDVPKGHVAVRVGRSYRRYVVRAAHLNHPAFRDLLALAEEEYGFVNVGPISIPCDESDFENILQQISSSPSKSSSSSSKFANLDESCCCCHVSIRREALPLLRGFAEKSVW